MRSQKHRVGLLEFGGGVPQRDFGTLGQPRLMNGDKGYLKYLVAPSFGQPYHLLQVTAAGRQSGQGRPSE